MEPPEGYRGKLESGQSLKLQKALYGLKQAGRLWYLKLCKILEEYGFKSLVTDPCVYVLKETSGGIVAILMIYVDDIAFACKDKKEKDKLLDVLKKHFEMKDLGELKYFLGIHLERTANTLTLSQAAYTRKVLQKFNMENCNPMVSPGTTNAHQGSDPNVKGKVPYRECVGSLIYLAVWTRPDIAHAVSQVSRTLENPTESNWISVKRILRYLSGTIDRSITYTKSKSTIAPQLSAFADANWADDESDSKSTTGYAVYLLGSLIVWKTKKQNTVAKSSTEAEYMALSDCTAEVIGLRQTLAELECPQADPTLIGEDNQGALLIAKNKATNKRTKHIRIRYHHIRDEIDKKQVKVVRVPTEYQSADIFTKALPPIKFAKALKLLDFPKKLLDQ
jgi:hypothetical protein